MSVVQFFPSTTPEVEIEAGRTCLYESLAWVKVTPSACWTSWNRPFGWQLIAEAKLGTLVSRPRVYSGLHMAAVLPTHPPSHDANQLFRYDVGRVIGIVPERGNSTIQVEFVPVALPSLPGLKLFTGTGIQEGKHRRYVVASY